MRCFLSILCTVLLLQACGSGNSGLIENAPLITETYQDDLGREVKLRKAPVRVVSLAPSVTEMIYAIGAQDRLVARSHACNYPQDVFDKPEITTYPDLDLPGIVALEPDLVITSTETHSERIIASFERLGVPLFFQDFHTTDDIYRNIEVLGKIMHQEAPAVHLADSLRAYEKHIADSASFQVKYPVMILVGINPLYVAGGGSYITSLIEKAGGRNAFAVLKKQYPEVTPEMVLKAAPEYLIIPSRDEQLYAQFVASYPELYAEMPAILNKNVYLADPDLMYRAGPRVGEALAFLARTLHPRLDTENPDAAP